MNLRPLCAALAALTFAIAAKVGASDTSPAAPVTAPALAQVPQGDRSGLILSTLDNETAYKISQAAIGKPVGDHVLLDRQGRPMRLADYRGKPLLVNFVYTACFHVCPTTTKNLQKAVQNTIAVLGTDRFNIVSIGFNQPFDSPEALKAFATSTASTCPTGNSSVPPRPSSTR